MPKRPLSKMKDAVPSEEITSSNKTNKTEVFTKDSKPPPPPPLPPPSTSAPPSLTPTVPLPSSTSSLTQPPPPSLKTKNNYKGHTLKPNERIQTTQMMPTNYTTFYHKYISTRKPCLITTSIDDVQRYIQPREASTEPTAFWDGIDGLKKGLKDVLTRSVTLEKKSRELKRFGSTRTGESDVKCSVEEWLAVLRKGGEGADDLYLSVQDEDEDEIEKDGDGKIGNMLFKSLVNAKNLSFPPPLIADNLVLSLGNLWIGHISPPSPSATSTSTSTSSTTSTKTEKVEAQGVSSGTHFDYHDNVYVVLKGGGKRFKVWSPDCFEGMETFGGGVVGENGVVVCDDDEGGQENNGDSDGDSEDEDEDYDEVPVSIGNGADYIDSDEELNNTATSVDDYDLLSPSSSPPLKAKKLNPSSSSSPSPSPQETEQKETEKPKKSRGPPNFSSLSPEQIQKLNLPFMEFTVLPGQVLYLPAGWFHEVATLFCSNDGKTKASSVSSDDNLHCALNYWFKPPAFGASVNDVYDDKNKSLDEYNKKVKSQLINATESASITHPEVSTSPVAASLSKVDVSSSSSSSSTSLSSPRPPPQAQPSFQITPYPNPNPPHHPHQNFTLKILVPNMLVGSLLGSSGAVIKELKLKYKCSINISSPGVYFPQSEMRTVVIVDASGGSLGTANKNVKDCFDDICWRVQFKAFDIVHTPAHNHNLNSNEAESNAANANANSTAVMVFSSAFCGVLIGKRGENVRRITAESKCKIHLASPPQGQGQGQQPTDTSRIERIVIITTPHPLSQLSICANLIIDLMAQFPAQSRYVNCTTKYGVKGVGVVVGVETEGLGVVFVKGGNPYVSQKLQQASASASTYISNAGVGSYVEYQLQPTQKQQYQPPQNQQPQPQPQQQQHQYMYQQQQQHPPQPPYYNQPPSLPPPPPLPPASQAPKPTSMSVSVSASASTSTSLKNRRETPSTSIQVSIPNILIPSIIGKSGSILSEIQTTSNTRIQLSQRDEFIPGTEDRIVTITGRADEVSYARQLMLARVEVEVTRQNGLRMGPVSVSGPTPLQPPPPPQQHQHHQHSGYGGGREWYGRGGGGGGYNSNPNNNYRDEQWGGRQR